MDYTATIRITVQGAEAPDEDFLNTIADQTEQYLSFEGETVTVDVEVTEDVGVV